MIWVSVVGKSAVGTAKPIVRVVAHALEKLILDVERGFMQIIRLSAVHVISRILDDIAAEVVSKFLIQVILPDDHTVFVGIERVILCPTLCSRLSFEYLVCSVNLWSVVDRCATATCDRTCEARNVGRGGHAFFSRIVANGITNGLS